ncbi:hypothetical protein N619_28590 [Ectopseudomonas oleovorans]|nr:hypothetical protein N619_28590 [Pseudomonas oleovorans]
MTTQLLSKPARKRCTTHRKYYGLNAVFCFLHPLQKRGYYFLIVSIYSFKVINHQHIEHTTFLQQFQYQFVLCFIAVCWIYPKNNTSIQQ